MSVIDEYFKNTISRDLAYLICDNQIGRGSAREVWSVNPIFGESLVLKIEDATRSFQNIYEWRIWNDFKNIEGIGEWLCPCVAISACGTILVQRRVDLIHKKPEKVPAWLSDVKMENLGMYEGRVVVLDYGTATLSMEVDLVDAEWVGGA